MKEKKKVKPKKELRIQRPERKQPIETKNQETCRSNQELIYRLTIKDSTVEYLYEIAPKVVKELSGKFGEILFKLYDEIRKHEKPMFTTEEGKEYFRIPIGFLAMTKRGSPETYNFRLRLARMIHLIQGIRATEASQHPVLKREYEIAKKAGKRTAWYYAVRPLNEQVLAEAEEAYRIIIESGLNPKRLSQQNVAQLLGEEIASQVYIGQNVSVRYLQFKMQRQYLYYLSETCNNRGFLRKETLMHKVVWQTKRELSYERVGRISKIEEREEWRRIERYAEKIWNGQRYFLLNETGMSYHRPTKAQKERYGLKTDSWIIAPIEG